MPPLIHSMTASHSENVSGLIERHVWKHFFAAKRIIVFWQGRQHACQSSLGSSTSERDGEQKLAGEGRVLGRDRMFVLSAALASRASVII